jgi:hypothetical protein
VLDAIPDELLLEPGWALVQAPISTAMITVPAVMTRGSDRECIRQILFFDGRAASLWATPG